MLQFVHAACKQALRCLLVCVRCVRVRSLTICGHLRPGACGGVQAVHAAQVLRTIVAALNDQVPEAVRCSQALPLGDRA